MLVYLPSTRADAAEVRAGSRGRRVPAEAEVGSDRSGYADTPAVRAAHGLVAAAPEDVAHTALAYAGLAALLAGVEPLRLVLAAEVPTQRVRPGAAPDLGEVVVEGLSWDEVTALFCDELPTAPRVAGVRRRVGGASISTALDLPEVTALLEEVDLLWYDPSELDWLP